MNAPNVSPPADSWLQLRQTSTAVGSGGYSSIGTIEGWILIAQGGRLLTLKGKTLSGETDEFWFEYSTDSGKLLFSDGSSLAVALADNQPHHFALVLDSNKGLSISLDGADAEKITDDALTHADSIIQQLTIGHYKDSSGSEHSGFAGRIAGLHLWKKTLTSAEILAVRNWHDSYCPIPDFGFKDGVRPNHGITPNDAPTELVGFLNPEIPSLVFYYEPKGHWVMEGTESDDPKQAELPDYDQHHHAIYEAPRYFLTTRDKNTNTLFIISDDSDQKPLRLIPNTFRQFEFKIHDGTLNDEIILTVNLELEAISPDSNNRGAISSALELLRESFSISGKTGKELPSVFRPEPNCPSKCNRPNFQVENKDLVQTLGDVFAHSPGNINTSLKGWNEVHMQDPFDSSNTGADNEIFAWPPASSKCYSMPIKNNNLVIPYGFKFKQISFAGGSMQSTLIANGSDLRSAATKTRSVKANVKAGCAFVSGSVSFNSNSEMGNTEENMYDSETMHSQHTFFVSCHTIVLDKSNVHFNGKGELEGFFPHINDYATNKKSGAEIFSTYGTHYAHAISFGARGKARQSYTKDTMSTLLQNCKKIGWGVEAKISANIAGFKGGVGAGYSQQDANEDSSKISATQNSQDSDYSCIGTSSCNSSGEAHVSDSNIVPVLVDLRPITELLAPPFFDTYEMTVDVRSKLINDLKAYLSGNDPSTVDVFHFLSLSFSRPWGFYQDDPDEPEKLREAVPGEGQFTCNSPVSVKVTGPSNSGKETLLQFKDFSFGLEIGSFTKQVFCYSGNKTDHQICVELTLPNTWSYGPLSPAAYPPRTVTLQFALDDLLSPQGASGTFVLPTTNVKLKGEATPYGEEGHPLHPFVIKLPIVLKKLDLQDAFFNGLPAEWKEMDPKET